MMMTTESASAHKRGRTCVGCGEKAEPAAMVRLVLGPDGAVAVDAAGGAFGRGAHVHPSVDCVTKAAKFGLARSYKAAVKVTASELGDAVHSAYLRRAEGLVLAAKRARHLVQGADETCEALASSPRAVIVVATNAASVVKRHPIATAIVDGRAFAWMDKATLGRMLGREEVAVCAVTDLAMADALRHALAVANAARVAPTATKEDASQLGSHFSPTDPAVGSEVTTCLEDR